MRGVNLPTGSNRYSEVGLVYQEILSGSLPTAVDGGLEIPKFHAVRIRSDAETLIEMEAYELAGTKVKVATIAANEIFIFNVGGGQKNDSKETVRIFLTAAGGTKVYLQVGREIEKEIPQY